MVVAAPKKKNIGRDKKSVNLNPTSNHHLPHHTMAVLGKRKAPEPSISRDDADDIFRRHFEAQFAPIDASASKRRAGSGDSSADDTDDSTEENTARRRRRAEGNGEDDGDDDDDSEWGGLSGDDGEQLEDELDDSDDEAEDGQDAAVQVVDYSTSQTPKPTAMSKRELKAFMVRALPGEWDSGGTMAYRNTNPSCLIVLSSARSDRNIQALRHYKHTILFIHAPRRRPLSPRPRSRATPPHLRIPSPLVRKAPVLILL